MEADNLSQAVESIRKGGIVAMTSMGAFQLEKVSLDLSRVPLMQKTVKGVIYGNWSPFEAVPSMLSLYAGGQLKTDEMTTRTYALDDIVQGYRDMKQGKNIRSIGNSVSQDATVTRRFGYPVAPSGTGDAI
ncbi:Zn-dependent alcohol dehydrogenase [Mycobacteroides chelonae]|nr:Zn-dependent alcohol dehydrogenase [Mycobacteroides chelonae]